MENMIYREKYVSISSPFLTLPPLTHRKTRSFAFPRATVPLGSDYVTCVQKFFFIAHLITQQIRLGRSLRGETETHKKS